MNQTTKGCGRRGQWAFLAAGLLLTAAACESRPEVKPASRPESPSAATISPVDSSEQGPAAQVAAAPPSPLAPAQMPAASSPAEAAPSEQAASAPATAAAPAKPATAEEAARVIDLRTFPLMQGAEETAERTLADLNYAIQGDIKAAFDYHRQKLLAQKWQELPNSYVGADSANTTFSRDGYKLSLMVYSVGQPGQVSVALSNHGNVDTGLLPAPAGVKPFYSTPIGTAYLTDASVEQTAAEVRRLLLGQGWEPYGDAGDVLYFKQNNIRLSARVGSAPAQDNKTFIDYSTELLSFDFPAPDDALEVQYSDSTAQLSFELPGSMDTVDSFYRQTLGKRGWEPTSDKPLPIDFKHFVIYRNPAKDLMEVTMYPFEEKMRVHVKFQTAEQVAEEERRAKAEITRREAEKNKPAPKVGVTLPAGAEGVEASPARIEFTVPQGQGKAAVEAVRKQLLGAGWKEEQALFEAMFGTVSLSKDGASISLTYLETGVLPPEVMIMAIGVELERGK